MSACIIYKCEKNLHSAASPSFGGHLVDSKMPFPWLLSQISQVYIKRCKHAQSASSLNNAYRIGQWSHASRKRPARVKDVTIYTRSILSRAQVSPTAWPPKRDFGGTPLSTEWFSHLPTKVGLPSVRWSPIQKKTGYADRRKTESVYIYASTSWLQSQSTSESLD